MNIKINTKDFFQLHGELNQLSGMAMGVIDSNIKAGNFKKGTKITNKFPQFVKLLDKINNQMQKYSIT
jgi:hypothetical protein